MKMNQALSNRINNLSESQTLEMARLSRELKEQGHDVISLSLGEPDFNIPEFIKDAAKQAIDENYSSYTPVNGYANLRKAISHKFKRDNDLYYSSEQIVVSTGAKQSIANVLMCLINPGDEVLLPVPYWVSYEAMTQLSEGKTTAIKTNIENDFKITAEQLEKSITTRSKVLLFSSPCNPSGSVYTKNELKAIAEVIVKHKNLYVISDEIYEHIVFDGKHESIASFDFIYDRVITINGLSKAFAMTGWRLGYLGAPLWIAKACTKMQGQITSGTNCIAQRAAIAALEADPKRIAYMQKSFLARRNLLINQLKGINGIKLNNPAGAFYLFIDISSYFGKKTTDGHTIKNASDLCMFILNECHVALVTGEAFGDPNCIRISYAASENNISEATKRIKESLLKLY